VGYAQVDGEARLTDFAALLTNPTLVMAFGHVVAAAWMTGGLVMAGVSSYHFIRRTREVELFRKSLRLGLVTGMIGVTFVMGFGFAQFDAVGAVQPTKFGDDADRAAAVADFTARFGPGDYLPPQWVGLPLALMMMIALTLSWGVFLLPLLYRDWIVKLRFPLFLMVLAVPFPFVAAICGWLTREVGRQPWAAYGLLRTADAVTPASGTTMLLSFVGFAALLGTLAIADWVLLARAAHRGPDVALGRPPTHEQARVPEPVLA
jgi:cytochrome d ubiquinol oxidase subunit I